MFLTLQIPLFDYRFFESAPQRTERPKWPEPGPKERIRYFGEVVDRNTRYVGPWDDEKKYCNAATVINFCGTGASHFYKSFYSRPNNARILFRRFQSDGRCLSKFEIGINDRLETLLKGAAGDNKDISTRIADHISKYLLCPVKIKIGSRLSDYVPLIEAGNNLKDAYYWATTVGKKSFDPKDVKHRVENCEPLLLLQLQSDTIGSAELKAQQVDMPFTEHEGIQLFCRHIPYNIGRLRYQLKTWIIVTPSKKETAPVYAPDFRSYSQVLRYLRINLLRIHVETCMEKRLMETFSTINEAYQVKDSQVRDRLYFYLHKLLLNLSNIQRNSQPQDKLVEAAFRLDEYYYGSTRIEDRIKMLGDYQDWLSKLPVSPKNEQVKVYVQQNQAALIEQQKTKPEEHIAFISYNHADEKKVNQLKDKLEAAGITVILDSASMQAGTAIDDFITQSIRRADAIVSIVSKNSLTSGWVGVETINAMFIKKYFPEKKFIPCNIGSEFMEDTFTDTARTKLRKRIKAIEKMAAIRAAGGRRFVDFDDEWRRLENLDKALPEIVQYLKNNLCIAIGGRSLNANLGKILEAIRAY